MDAVRQARTLRLLANSFLEWDGSTHWQKALSAVGNSTIITFFMLHYYLPVLCSEGLANSEHSHALGLLLKVSILLQYDPNNDIIHRGKLSSKLMPGLYCSLPIAQNHQLTALARGVL